MNKQKTLLAATIAAALSLPAMAAEPLRMVVDYKPGKGNAVKAALAKQGIEVKRDLAALGSLALSVRKDQLKALSEIKGLSSLYPDMPRRPMSNGGEISPYGIAMTQSDQVQYQGGQKVCVIDSGYDLGHPDLPAGANVTGQDDGAGPWYQDDHSHGTHVAGTIAALANGEGVVGVVPDGTMDLHIIRVFDGEGAFIYASDLAGAVNDCVAAGSTVVSMSLGGITRSRVEQRAMDNAVKAGAIVVAAAGNDGNATHSYPASYDSVISVAAIDSGYNHADFSQRTAQVELAGPGVGTLSTVPRGFGESGIASVSQDGNGYEALPINGSATGSVTAETVDCGLNTSSCGDVTGKICLIERGEISFADKVAQCESDGGVAAVIYNNAPGNFSATLGDGVFSPLVAVSLSQADGQALVANAGSEATVAIEAAADYDYKSGTSMATPHVSGVAALVWSNFPECSANGIRLALRESAMDLGESGYDYQFGWGLVQAKAAVDHIAANGCKAPNGKIRGGNGAPR